MSIGEILTSNILLKDIKYDAWTSSESETLSYA